MAYHKSWSGFLKLSLVSVPVKAYTAISASDEIHLNQLHGECHSRIKQKKFCPVHGELAADQIVSGYEYADDKYVVIDTDELEKLRTESDKSVTIDAFVPAGTVDPLYHKDRTLYLVPDGPAGQKPYTVFLKAMTDKNVHAIGQVVFSKKESLVLVRPLEGLLAMTFLFYESDVRKASLFKPEAPASAYSPEELMLAGSLIDAQTNKAFTLSKYKDVYRERLQQLINAKVEGKEIVSPPAAAEAPIINLMEALKQSVAKAKGASAAEPATPAAAAAASAAVAAVAAGTEEPAAAAVGDGKPPKKMAPAARPAAEKAPRKKKSS